MRKLPAIVFILFYCAGTLLFPLGDFSHNKSIATTYEQCKGEDPDIDPIDFVFEHLLNLGCVMEHFEHESEENERPHESDQQFRFASQVLIITPRHIAFEGQPPLPEIVERIKHPLYPGHFILPGMPDDVFHPSSA